MNEYVWNISGIILTVESQILGESLVLMALFPLQTPHWLAWGWTWLLQ